MVAGPLLYSFVAFWTMLLVPQPEPRGWPVAPAADSASVHAQLVLNISEFQVAWQQAWQSAETARVKRQGSGLGDLRRWSLVHCHPDGDVDGALPQEKTVRDSMRKARVSNSMIQSRSSWYAVCPSWFLDPTADAQELPGGRDGILTESIKRRIVDLRVRLIAQLNQALAQNPNDGWISAQIIRFQLDQGDLDAALTSAKSCGAEA